MPVANLCSDRSSTASYSRNTAVVTSGMQRRSATAYSTLLLAPSWLRSPATRTEVSSTTRMAKSYVTSYRMSTYSVFRTGNEAGSSTGGTTMTSTRSRPTDRRRLHSSLVFVANPASAPTITSSTSRRIRMGTAESGLRSSVQIIWPTADWLTVHGGLYVLPGAFLESNRERVRDSARIPDEPEVDRVPRAEWPQERRPSSSQQIGEGPPSSWAYTRRRAKIRRRADGRPRGRRTV